MFQASLVCWCVGFLERFHSHGSCWHLIVHWWSWFHNAAPFTIVSQQHCPSRPNYPQKTVFIAIIVFVLQRFVRFDDGLLLSSGTNWLLSKTNFGYFVPFCGFSKDPIKLSLPDFGQNDWSTHFMEYLSKYTWVHCAHNIFSSSFGLDVKITPGKELDKCLSKYTCVEGKFQFFWRQGENNGKL